MISAYFVTLTGRNDNTNIKTDTWPQEAGLKLGIWRIPNPNPTESGTFS